MAKELTVLRFLEVERDGKIVAVPVEEITPEERKQWQKNVTERLSRHLSGLPLREPEFTKRLIRDGIL
ncbi:MAG: hypothetical protein J6C96_12655 [Oscillospiraceae bacterium]|nr:hypothetical protein [Oscillospiraceae bacterium]